MYGSVQWRYPLTTTSRIEEVQGEEASSGCIIWNDCINKAIGVALCLGVDYLTFGHFYGADFNMGWLWNAKKPHSMTWKFFEWSLVSLASSK
jgi:hypothetical protein